MQNDQREPANATVNIVTFDKPGGFGCAVEVSARNGRARRELTGTFKDRYSAIEHAEKQIAERLAAIFN
jgi:hypothetical protein